MAPAPVTTPTSNGDTDQVQAFEKVVTPPGNDELPQHPTEPSAVIQEEEEDNVVVNPVAVADNEQD